MDKKIFSLFLISLLFLPALAFAIPGSFADLFKTIALDVMWLVFGGIAVVCIVYSGILLLTSFGNPQKITIAKSALLWGIGGIIVGLVGYSVISIFSKILS